MESQRKGSSRHKADCAFVDSNPAIGESLKRDLSNIREL